MLLTLFLGHSRGSRTKKGGFQKEHDDGNVPYILTGDGDTLQPGWELEGERE